MKTQDTDAVHTAVAPGMAWAALRKPRRVSDEWSRRFVRIAEIALAEEGTLAIILQPSRYLRGQRYSDRQPK